MKRIEVTDIRSFVQEQVRKKQPPFFWRLQPPPKKLEHFVEYQSKHRRADSGTLEIFFLGGRGYSFEAVVRRYAELEDKRDLTTSEGPLPSGVDFELESHVPVTEENKTTLLGVIGPGGRTTVFRPANGDMTRVDVTIRRRILGDQGQWRKLPQILRPIYKALEEDFILLKGGLTVRAAFGYFELSKYEVQLLMRPVFLFAIEQEQDPKGRWPGFQRIVVSPATTAAEFDNSEGLGMWAESTRCSG